MIFTNKSILPIIELVKYNDAIRNNKNHYATFIVTCELESQLNLILGLGRTLKEEIKGIGITGVKFMDIKIKNEFETIPGIQESVGEILQNLEKILFTSSQDEIDEIKTHISFKGPGFVTAKDINLPPFIQLIDPTQHIAQINEAIDFSIELRIENRDHIRNLRNVHHEDGSFTIAPITLPVYSVEFERAPTIGNEYRLFMNVITDIRIHPVEAISKAVFKLINLWRKFLFVPDKIMPTNPMKREFFFPLPQLVDYQKKGDFIVDLVDYQKKGDFIYGKFSIRCYLKSQLHLIHRLKGTLFSLFNEIRGLVGITGVKFMNIKIKNEFETIPGIQESVGEILQNLEKILFTSSQDEIDEIKTHISFKGPGFVTAKDINLPPFIQLIDPTQHIAQINEAIDFSIELRIENRDHIRNLRNVHHEDGGFTIAAVSMPVRLLEFERAPTIGNEYHLFMDVLTDLRTDPFKAVTKGMLNLITLLSEFLFSLLEL